MHYLENAIDKDNSFGKYVTVIIVTFISMSLISGLFTGIVETVYLLNKDSDFAPKMFSSINDLYDAGMPENLVLISAFFPTVIVLLISWALIRKMHKRTFSMTVNGRQTVRWNHVFAGFGVWFLLMFVFLAISYIAGADNFVWQFNIAKFIPLLIISLLMIPFQSAFEEYIFRGYIAQGIGALTKNRWLVIFIPGLLFGLAHGASTEVAEHGFWVIMPQYILFGLFFGLIAVLDDGIELSIGIHAANNLFVCLFVTKETSSLRTPAILKQLEISHLAESIGLLVAISLTVFYFYRKYKWNLSILNEKIECEQLTENECNANHD
jgi:membrane protease YdiL (CAAX protease family)